MIQARTQLLKWHAEGALIAASCIGTFLVAETGLLDQQGATTTWWLGNALSLSMNVETVADGLMSYEFLPVGPLMPLGLLIQNK